MTAAVVLAHNAPNALAASPASPAVETSSAPSAALVAEAKATVTHALDKMAARESLSDPHIVVTVLPGRQTVPACTVPFDIHLSDSRHLTRLLLDLRCPTSDESLRWVARASLKARVPVAVHDIAAGQAIDTSDLTLDLRPLPTLTGIVTQPRDAIGLSSRSVIRAGQVLQRKNLAQPMLVRRGQSVRIVARQSAVAIAAVGVAMDNGARNALIRVKNAGTGTIIRARVSGSGEVNPLIARRDSDPLPPAR